MLINSSKSGNQEIGNEGIISLQIVDCVDERTMANPVVDNWYAGFAVSSSGNYYNTLDQ